jgi:1-acyl-sn-glycerol-3-phosphate acyltransferase
MRRVRGCWRLLLLVLVTLVLWPAWLVGRRTAVRRLWAVTAMRILRVAITVRGPRPTAPSFVVANHLSYLDIAVLWTAVDGDFLAKAEVAGWPVIGRLAASTGTLFTERHRRADLPRVVASLQQRLARGRSVIVFPEGTSSPGERVLPLKAGLFEVAVVTGCPIVCACLAYATPDGAPPVRDAVCWWDDTSFARHIFRLACLPSVRASIDFAAPPRPFADRKTLATQSHRILQELHELAR